MTTHSPTVLVVEDEAQIRRFVREAVEGEGCSVHEAETLARARIEAGTRRPDLAIVDLGLPDGDGVELVRELRSWSGMPIIVLSARVAEAQKVEALDAGADDYLTKPFGVAELLARVRAQLRRRAIGDLADAAGVRFGPVQVDPHRRTVERDGEPVHLTAIEFRLLAYLVSHPDRVLTHRQLLQAVWGPGHAQDAHYLRVYMGHLRRKLERDAARPEHLKTEIGVGYRFVA